MRHQWATSLPSSLPNTAAANTTGYSCTGASPCSGTQTRATDGKAYLCVRARDGTGASGNWSSITCSGFYGRDTVIPANPVVTGATITNDTTPTINVTGGDVLSGVAGFTADIYDAGGVYCATASTSSNPGSLSMPKSCYDGSIIGRVNPIKHPFAWLKQMWLPPARAQVGGDGIYRFAVRSYDYANNYSNIVNYNVTIDTTPPSPAPTINPFGYVNPNNGISYVNSANVASVTFSGACSGATVRLYVNGIYVITTGCPSGACARLLRRTLTACWLTASGFPATRALNHLKP